jgi:hypothetical protein
MDRRTVDSGNLNSGPELAASATTNQADASTATGARDISGRTAPDRGIPPAAALVPPCRHWDAALCIPRLLPASGPAAPSAATPRTGRRPARVPRAR